MDTVSFDTIYKIRLHIDRIEKRSVLLADRRKWLQLTAALDVLEDSSWAVVYYIESDYPSDVKGKYLFTYGLLQALFLQQDAVKSINEALFDKSVDIKHNYPKAHLVREMRNDVSGHPTTRNGGKEFIYLSQHSMEKDSFEYMKEMTKNSEPLFIPVDVFATIDENAKYVNAVLKNTKDELDKEFREYIDAHRGREMKKIFSMLHYAREKVVLNSPLKAQMYEDTKTMVSKCKDEIIQRFGSLKSADSYYYLFEDIDKIYRLIDTGLNLIPQTIRSDIEKYLIEVLFINLEKLEQYSIETDEYFNSIGE